MKGFTWLLLMLLTGITLPAQNKNIPDLQLLTSGTPTSIRGLSVVSDEVVWVSGSNGTIGRSTDGGKNWKWMKVRGFEKTDFRDIEAFEAATAVIISSSD